MTAPSLRGQLAAAKRAKKDEFYTQLTTIERELQHYRPHFRGKTVLLNCDDPEWSNFWRFFALNFEFLGLRKLIATHYHPTEPTYKLVLDRDTNGADAVKSPLAGNGDFRSPEVVALLAEADIVVTNPPFSLFREYIAQLVEHDKKFLVIGNQNAITYKQIWPLIQDGKIWLGTTTNKVVEFAVPDDYDAPASARRDDHDRRLVKVPAITWFTNLEIPRRHDEVILFRKYDPADYPTYDNFDAIEVSKVADIPRDYDGLMGVPITFLGKHNPEQFEIISGWNSGVDVPNPGAADTEYEDKHGATKIWNGPTVNRKTKYYRIIIRRR